MFSVIRAVLSGWNGNLKSPQNYLTQTFNHSTTIIGMLAIQENVRWAAQTG
jgi:hypothetical protein